MPPDPLEQVRKELAIALADADNKLLKAVDTAKNLAKALGDTTSETKKIFEDNTRIKNSLADTLDLAKRLGTEYVDIDRITKRINANITAQQYQEKAIADLRAAYEADMLSLGAQAKDIADIAIETQKILDLEKERDRLSTKAKLASFEALDYQKKAAEAAKIANASATSTNLANAAQAAIDEVEAKKRQDTAKNNASLAKSAYDQAKLSIRVDEVRLGILRKNLDALLEEEIQLEKIEKNIEKGNVQFTSTRGNTYKLDIIED